MSNRKAGGQKTVLALDQGTTGSTAMIVAEDGRILAKAYREFTQHFPKPGWVEHDAEEIWDVTRGAAREALETSGARPEAVGITNQRETVVAWDRETGKPLHRALVWQDRRTATRCRQLAREKGLPFLADRTGLVWDPYFSGSKIEWLLDHVPGLRERASDGKVFFGTIDSWLVYCLTGGRDFVTDHTNASRTMLYNIRLKAWDPELLGLFGVPEASLPKVCHSSEVVGIVDGNHFGFEIPISGIAGDQQAALFGQACWSPGEAKSTYGTGAFLLMNVGPDYRPMGDARGLLTTIACTATGAPTLALEGSIFIAGAAVQWLRDGLRIIEHASETDELARSVADNGGVYFVPALVGLGAPHWEPGARGTIVGLTRGTSRAHIARAALESMAYGTRDVAHTMSSVSRVPLQVMKADGGATTNDWFMQFLADVLRVRVARPDVIETTALGAAGLAGLATGVWKTPDDFSASRTYQTFEAQSDREDDYKGWRRAVDTALHWVKSTG